MRKISILFISILLLANCTNVDKPEKIDLAEIRKSVTPTDSSLIAELLKSTFLKRIKDFPSIKDSAGLISELKYAFTLVIDKSDEQKQKEKITAYKKVKLFGSDKEYIFVEFDYFVGCNASYPWKHQMLFTVEGKLVSKLSELKCEFVELLKNENPFLLTLNSTAKGNGGHFIYKMSGDTLENVLEDIKDFEVRTYDCHEDKSVYSPAELKLKTKDFNKDGYNDISFSGLNVLIQGRTKEGVWYDTEDINGKTIAYSIENPFKKIPIEFIFLYDKTSGHFKVKENYVKKYDLNS